jgi:SAM-dependent methyltransferase
MNPYRQFALKVEDYIRYRWSYSSQAIETILQVAGLSEASVVADIAAGPGTLSHHFVNRVSRVFAVEPNREMRQVAENLLGHHPSFTSVSGLAHVTPLLDDTVDLILVGRALHWFEPEATRTEFLRILKPGGWLAILQTPCTDTALLEAIDTLRTEAYGWNVVGDKKHHIKVPPSFYFGHDAFETRYFPDVVQETWNDFLGRLSSFSPAPNVDHVLRPKFERAARAIFDQFGTGECISITMATELKLGRMEASC